MVICAQYCTVTTPWLKQAIIGATGARYGDFLSAYGGKGSGHDLTGENRLFIGLYAVVWFCPWIDSITTMGSTLIHRAREVKQKPYYYYSIQ